MTVKGMAMHNNHNHTLYIYIVICPQPFIFSQWIPVWAISWKVQKGLKLNLVHVNERKYRRQKT